jgi:hypothetical protein
LNDRPKSQPKTAIGIKIAPSKNNPTSTAIMMKKQPHLGLYVSTGFSMTGGSSGTAE